MMTLTKEQEHVLRYLLSLKRGTDNTISMSRSVYTLTDVSEKDFVKCLDYLEQCQFISIHWHSPHHDDFNYTRDIKLLPDAINYFQNKKIESVSNRRDWVKTYIPIILSLIALLKSFQPEIISVLKLIMQLLKK